MPEVAQPNRALSGVELKELIVKDLESILEQDSMLASHIAYSRVSYSVNVKIQTANPMMPNWSNKVKSRKSTAQQVEGKPQMQAVESFPLTRGKEEEAMDAGVERTRVIVSPNQSRIENGLGVPITRRNEEGNVVEEKVMYEKDMLPDDGPYADVVTEKKLTPAEIETDD
jgi:hypothetical protein